MKAIAFFAKVWSVVSDGKRTISWFSRKDPKSVVSAHADLMLLMPLTRLLMLPPVDWKAWVIQ